MRVRVLRLRWFLINLQGWEIMINLSLPVRTHISRKKCAVMFCQWSVNVPISILSKVERKYICTSQPITLNNQNIILPCMLLPKGKRQKTSRK